MATISNPGFSSGLSGLIPQLVAAERAPGDARFNRIESVATAQISAFGKVTAGLSGLQGALAKFEGVGASLGRKVSVGTDAGFTATANTKAALGNYQISVESLATTHKLQSAALAKDAAGKDAQLGHGSLSITVGDGEAIEVEIAEGKGSLAEIRDAINAKAGGKEVTATLVRGDSGDVLVLASTKTGTDGRMQISTSGGDGGLEALASSGGTMTVADAGNDARVLIDGISRTSSSNRLDEAIDGITIDLTKAKPGENSSLSLTSDASPLKASMLSFISAYNTALSALRTQSASGGESSSGAPLSGDSAPRSITQSLRGAISANYAQLAELGLKTGVDGSLSLDGSKFDTAIAADPEAVQRLLGDEGALQKPMAAALKSLLGDDGMIKGRTDALNSRLKSLKTERERFDRRISDVQARYTRQFTALDMMVSQMQSTSSFLTQQLSQITQLKQS
ncbi:flagellar filament capping protein FliD [Lysobacter ciconiae]|uniref:Flagellar hook-associated protein 2 n=1 Tax=Novilysobacter ciconiae TaxID=2781022 RepID=A0A7S6UH47_9GAMM|nr:flagellar filament capping protein FliD [Lysobacter ciconiae]QOW20124.1 flagellar filament capping protein FliD [Lysobacter ciconiae]